jgi:DNA-binding CsgD family transcriptional regulator/GAF domain-containing protein
MDLRPQEQRILFQIIDALNSSLELDDTLPQAYAMLTELIPADRGAFCVSKPGRSDEYSWTTAELPREWFEHYAEMATHDFVRDAVVKRPNTVLRDSEMVSRDALEGSFLYQRSRDLGMRLEHVMAVSLVTDPTWHGGLTLYRESRRPFSDRERSLLQDLAPILAKAMRNCLLFHEQSRTAAALSTLLSSNGAEAIVISLQAGEVARTRSVAEVLERWFSLSERGDEGLPAPLLEHLTRAVCAGPPRPAASSAWVRSGSDGDLRVSVRPLPDARAGALWALVLQETSHAASPPTAWRERLSRRELEITSRVLKGWDNRLIAEDSQCAEGTVKKHLQRVFNKLGVSSRSALLSLAMRQR